MPGAKTKKHLDILFAIKNLSTAKGGAERVLQMIANALVAKGHNVSVITFDPEGSKPFYKLDERINLVCLGIGNIEKKSTFLESVLRIKALRYYIKKNNLDIVVPFMHSMFVPMAFAAWGLKKPVIASEHIVPAHYKNQPHEFFLFVFSWVLINKMTVLSDPVKQLYPKFTHRKMVTIPNPLQSPYADIQTEPPQKSRKVILNVGRLEDQKDQKTLINAFALLTEIHKDWDLEIYGEGNLRNELQSLINQKGLQNRVFLKGVTPNIQAVYQNADIFAMPSNYESFGLATAEAMAHELPCVGFQECPGTNELIKNEHNGLLVSRKPDAVKNFSQALSTLMGDQNLRTSYGKNGPETIKAFDIANISEKWETLIIETIDNKN